MKRVLVFSFFPAFVPPSSGGELRLFHMYRELSKTVDIVLLSSSHHGRAEERIRHGAQFLERRIPKCDWFISEWQRLSSAASGGDLSAVCVASSGRYATPLHSAYLEEYSRADVIIHESPFTAPYDLFLGWDRKPRVYNSYNCETALFKQLHPDSRSAPIHAVVETCERQLLVHADLVTYCAEADLEQFRTLGGGALNQVLELPNGLLPSAGCTREYATPVAPRAVFIGSGHLPNVEAARFIAEHLALEVPTCEFDIIGDCLPEGHYPSNVKRHGRVNEAVKTRLIADAVIGLNPMLEGSGSNLKVLEFFDGGLPILTTPFGVRGYLIEAGTHCIVAERADFANALRGLLADPSLRRRIGEAGRAHVVASYSWAGIAERLRSAITSLTSCKPDGTLGRPYVLELNDFDPFAGFGGGAVRIQGLFGALDQAQPVVFTCFSESDEISVVPIGTQSLLVRVPKTIEHRTDTDSTNAMHWVSASDIVSLEHAPKNPYLSRIYGILRQNAALVVVDHVYMSRLPMEWGDPFVYSSQNNETNLKRDLLQAHPLRDRLVDLVAVTEDDAIRSSRVVVAVADGDAESFVRGRAAAAPVVVVRNGAMGPGAVEPADRARAAAEVTRPSAVFIGSAHMPNVDACKFIAAALAPKLPSVQFHVIGGAGQSLPEPVPPNVKVWGVVTDSLRSAILESADLALNPMFAGSGSNVKLADYMGHGLHTLTTPFGARGYPASVAPHITVADADDWASALVELLDRPALTSPHRRAERKEVFARDLAMSVQGSRYAHLIRSLQTPKRRVLFVTYRWVSPTRGGGEANLLEYMKELSASGQFLIDVVAPDVAEFAEAFRFGVTTKPVGEGGAPIDLPNVRYRRFETDPVDLAQIELHARAMWSVQPMFEREKFDRIPRERLASGLAWGWAWSDGQGGRWGYSSCGIYLDAPKRVQLVLFSVQPVTVFITDADGGKVAALTLNGEGEVGFDAPRGDLLLSVSGPPQSAADPRPLGLYLKACSLDGIPVDLKQPALADRSDPDAGAEFERLHAAMVAARNPSGLDLTGMRGPHSAALERFIQENVHRYDLVITHNTVFKTARVAIESARRNGVPVIAVPHAHLDDDFYHFQDVAGMAAQADLVLAAPLAACDYFKKRGARRVEHMTPGCDAGERFTEDDEVSFGKVLRIDEPFVLVLGRKSAAKGYSKIVDAVDRVSTRRPVKTVIIGPDDDRLPLDSSNAIYLGPQPRDVLRGALRRCVALANMSSSESFGIVLLEAWLARKPVIANRGCAAFADLAEHGVNALLVDDATLEVAIETLLTRPDLARELGERGFSTAKQYDHRIVNERFLNACLSLLRIPRAERSSPTPALKGQTQGVH